MVPALIVSLLVAAPDARWGHAMTFDSDRGVVLMAGGTREGRVPLADLWAFDGKAWTRLAGGEDAESPPARDALVLVHDPKRKRAVLWGGRTNDAILSDTWEWDGARWERIATEGPSPTRIHSVGAYDPARGRVVIFGGVSAGDEFQRDTWSFDGAKWVRDDDAGPEKAAPNGMAWDERAKTLLLLANDLGTGETRLWARQEKGWALRGDAAAPPAVEPIAPIAPDPVGRGALLLLDAPRGATHRVEGGSWIAIPSACPPARTGHAMAFDAKRGRVVLFGGGVERRRLGDTWEWDGNSWRRIEP